jgi:hypothetical protein
MNLMKIHLKCDPEQNVAELLGRPENCCNPDEILILWGFKRAGVFWWSVYGKFRLIKLPALSTL